MCLSSSAVFVQPYLEGEVGGEAVLLEHRLLVQPDHGTGERVHAVERVDGDVAVRDAGALLAIERRAPRVLRRGFCRLLLRLLRRPFVADTTADADDAQGQGRGGRRRGLRRRRC